VTHGASVKILQVINQVSGRAGAEVSLRDIVTRTSDEFAHAIVVLGTTNHQLDPFERVGIPCYVPAPGTPTGRLAQIRDVPSRLTSGYHAISETPAQHATTHFGVPRTRVRVVPRGRSRDELGERSPERRAAVRGKVGWGARPVIINVAWEDSQKEQVTLLDARLRTLGREESDERLGARMDLVDMRALLRRPRLEISSGALGASV
jgi:hypothetical protein